MQEFNRDISIMTIREFSKLRQEEIAAKGKHEFKGISILEALAATGLRSVRYLKEIENIKTLVANDIDPTATELMKKNFDYNQIQSEEGPYEIHTADAIDLMNSMRKERHERRNMQSEYCSTSFLSQYQAWALIFSPSGNAFWKTPSNSALQLRAIGCNIYLDIEPQDRITGVVSNSFGPKDFTRKDKRFIHLSTCFFDVVDLDPYGTAVPFLESALSSIADGGLLAVTFTDMAVLCARNPHVCFYKYGAAPLSKDYCHELALRIVLKMVSEMANRQQKYNIYTQYIFYEWLHVLQKLQDFTKVVQSQRIQNYIVIQWVCGSLY